MLESAAESKHYRETKKRVRKPEEGNLKKTLGKKTEQGKEQVQTAHIRIFL
jgi:hypothetical protein